MIAARVVSPWPAAILIVVLLFAPAGVMAADPGRAVPRADRVADDREPLVPAAEQAMQELALYAIALVGVAYRFGGDVPETGFDCSGLVRHVFRQVSGAALPRTAREQSRLGAHVPAGELQAGDLVFFDTRRFAYSHVGIYLGDHRFIHAPHTGRPVEIAELGQPYWQQRFNGARRLAGVLPVQLPGRAEPVNAAPRSPSGAHQPAITYDMTGA